MDMMPADQARAQLMKTNEEFRQLAMQHSKVDRRVEELASRRFPSQEEQVEEHRLKKKKLHLKDQMQQFVREHAAHA